MSDKKNEQILKWLSSNEDFNCKCPLCDGSSDCCQCYPDMSGTGSHSGPVSFNASTDHCFNTLRSRTPLHSHEHDIKFRSLRAKRTKNHDYKANSDSSLVRGCSVETVKWSVSGADLLFRADKTLFPVHRVVMAKHSHAFKQEVRDTQKLVIELPVKARYFKIALEFMYGIEIVLTKSNVSEVSCIAEMYGMDTLVDRCNSHIQKSKQLRYLKKKKCYKGIQDFLGLRIFVKE